MRALLALCCLVCLFAAENVTARDKVFQDLSGAYRVKEGMTAPEELQTMKGQAPVRIFQTRVTHDLACASPL